RHVVARNSVGTIFLTKTLCPDPAPAARYAVFGGSVPIHPVRLWPPRGLSADLRRAARQSGRPRAVHRHERHALHRRAGDGPPASLNSIPPHCPAVDLHLSRVPLDPLRVTD